MIVPRGLRRLVHILGGGRTAVAIATAARVAPVLVASMLVASMLVAPAQAQDADTCQMCHDDKSLTKNERGEVVSLYVDLGQYGRSVHGREGVGCVDCHHTLAGVEH